MKSYRTGRVVGRVLAVAITSTALALGAKAAQETVLYNFGSPPDGNYPGSNLVLDRSGNLYGTTIQGGAFGSGTVFRLKAHNGQWTENVLYSFCKQSGCPDGSQPYAGLVLDAAGDLYGTTSVGGVYGYGVVFKLIRTVNGGWRQIVLHSFGNGTDGRTPLAGLTFDKVGNLYGTTSGGGTSTASCFGGCGTVFELTSGNNGQWAESSIYNFCSQTQCADGNSLTAGVVFDPSGNLYGTTVYGGDISGDGTVFELMPVGNGLWTQRTLYKFSGADGLNPHASLVLDKAGNLYGTTAFGGSFGNNGTVFTLRRNADGQWTERVLYSFCAQFSCSDGSGPYASLVFDKTGNLLGATPSGGASQWGVVFELSPTKTGRWTETVLHSFAGGTDGINPHAGLTLDSAGNLFGVAFQGGTIGYGTAFQVTP